MNPTLPGKSEQKFLGLPFCCTVEHVQLKNVTVDVMNIIVTSRPTVGVKCAPKCIKMRHFEGKNTKKFLQRGTAPGPSQISLPLSAPSAPPFECIQHLNPQTTFLAMGLIAI